MNARVGLDFDNTLIDYDAVFTAEGARRGLIAAGKNGVKAAAIAAGGERLWMTIQGQAYGRGIAGASLVAGVADFLAAAKSAGVTLFIVSHKTEFGHYDATRTNLRTAARAWMQAAGFFDPTGFGLAEEHVHFESTLDAKVARIAALDLAFFVDDLANVLTHPDFPPATRGLWFHAADIAPPPGCERCADWPTIGARILRHG